MEEYFLGLLTEENEKLDPWFDNLKIYNSFLKFKIDTAIDIKTINHKMYKNIRNRSPLRPVEGRFRSPCGTLSRKGKFRTSRTHKGKNIFEMYILNGRGIENVLSRDDAHLMETIIKFGQVQEAARKMNL